MTTTPAGLQMVPPTLNYNEADQTLTSAFDKGNQITYKKK